MAFVIHQNPQMFFYIGCRTTDYKLGWFVRLQGAITRQFLTLQARAAFQYSEIQGMVWTLKLYDSDTPKPKSIGI